MSPVERASAFSRTFSGYALLVTHNSRLYGCWVLGALYARIKAYDGGIHANGYYGAFPWVAADNPKLKKLIEESVRLR